MTPIDMPKFLGNNFRNEIVRRVNQVRTEHDLELWVIECQSWMTHIVEKESRYQGLTDDGRLTLADACAAAFNEVYFEHYERIKHGQHIAEGR